ncbi:hypothetical protein M9Y10_040425 [Tritrichomonas musculus]|uniref:Uncharacterized protein n=1 Tax=Tritrichomonas musculus TaxID=1915356 RepID=A0ABR2GPJ7_9EUKA
MELVARQGVDHHRLPELHAQPAVLHSSIEGRETVLLATDVVENLWLRQFFVVQ